MTEEGRSLLITGAAGFTGRQAVRYFAAAGRRVTAVVRQPLPQEGENTSPLFPAGVNVRVCDLSDKEAVRELVRETAPDEVLHLAGRNSVPESWQNPLLYMEANVMAVLHILDALRAFPACRILVAGSRLKFRPEAGEAPPHPYSLSKTLAELSALSWGTLFGQDVRVAEPCNLIGPGPSTGFCALLAGHIVRCERGEAAGTFRLSSRHASRDFLDVRDAVRAYDRILSEGSAGMVYRIESGTARTLGEVAAALLAETTAHVPIDWGPAAAETAASLQPQPEPQLQPQLHPQPQLQPQPQPQKPVRESDAAQLGWRPETELRQSLRDSLRYFRQEADV